MTLTSTPFGDSGARGAFGSDVLQHLDVLFGAALRMTRHRQDAEDLVQETYLRATQSADRYQGQGSANCRGWLFRIMTNLYIDHYRRRRRSPETVEFEEDGATGQYGRMESSRSGEPVSDELPGEDIETTLFLSFSDEVKAAIDGLKDVYRETMVLRYIMGFTYQECADMLGIPVGTVMSRIYRARRVLLEVLEAYGREKGHRPADGFSLEAIG